jgi:Ni/Co efflux regulator RcnB
MNGIRKAFAISTIALTFASGLSFAQDHHDDQNNDHHRDHDSQRYVHHDHWRKGYHMDHQDWDRGERIDYRHYHLRRPPRGYEWREVDGNYVLAAVATGVIASVIVASTVH